MAVETNVSSEKAKGVLSRVIDRAAAKATQVVYDKVFGITPDQRRISDHASAQRKAEEKAKQGDNR